MPASNTIACPKCSTSLRVRSLKAVSESDACPECGALLKSAAEQSARNAEPIHPALAKPDAPERPPEFAAEFETPVTKTSPVTIAAAGTGLVALIVIAGLSWGTPDPKPRGWLPAQNGTAIPAPVETDFAGENATEPAPEKLIASTDPQSELITPQPDSGKPAWSKTGPAERNLPEEIQNPSGSLTNPSVVTAGVNPRSGTPSPIQQTSGTDPIPDAPLPPGTLPRTETLPAPPRPQPATLDERLAVSLTKFELGSPVTLKSLLETVEIMAELRIEISPDIPSATLDRELVFTLEDTSPRGILDEAAKRSGLSVAIGNDRVRLKPAAE